MFRVLIADDHPLFRTALRQVIESLFADYEILEAGTLDEASRFIDEADSYEMDLVLLDLQMPGSSGFSGLVSLRNAAPWVPIIVVSASSTDDIVRSAITYGASGFIPKSFSKEEIGVGMTRVLSGDVFVPFPDTLFPPTRANALRADSEERLAALTHGELRVLDLLAKGKSNKIIAYELGIKESTVKAHITAILRKLKVHSRTQAVLAARDLSFGRS
ncbi:MAG: response regulator transcription factor [Rhodospirillales bacterium]|jgi:DNA-binding NarL/FixJ family response regulator|nr:response regulator transcription factor [Rhodospirillales bacterium]